MQGPGLIFDRLRRLLTEQAESFNGILSVSVLDLISGDRIDVRSDVLLGCGSSIKITILMELCRQHHAGIINLDDPYAVDPENRVGGAGILQYLRPELVLTGRDLATAMIVLSDNVATNACIDLAGIENVEATIQSITPNSHLYRKMQSYSSAARGVENVSTAADMAQWINLLASDQFISPAVCNEAMSILSLRKSGLLNQALPADLTISSKSGGLNGGKSDVGLVGLKRRPYIVSIMTAFVFDGNGHEAVVGTARLIHQHMAVLAKYKPMGVPHADYFVAQGRAPMNVIEEK